MKHTKIDPEEMSRLLREGKRTYEIAAHFGCTSGAVSQAKRKLGVEIVKSMHKEQAPVIAKRQTDAMETLLTRVHECEAHLEWIASAVTPQTDAEYRAWQDQAIKLTAEVRKLITSMADIRIKIYHAEDVERALLIMFQEIGNESLDCQKRIKTRLKKASIPFRLDDEFPGAKD
jgi:hypothetical protein